MYKCPICGKEYEKIRALHGHMLKSHMQEYKSKGCKLSAYGITLNKDLESALQKSNVPADFRPLDKQVEGEKIAYDEGYRYIADGIVYTSGEVKGMGWL